MEEITIETKIIEVDQNTIDEQKPLTQIDPSIFQQMKTNEGSTFTFNQLNRRHHIRPQQKRIQSFTHFVVFCRLSFLSRNHA
jgi:hypothetical protein